MSEPIRRPTASERRASLLQAAAEVFFEQGYSATSIDAIIERVGGSKRAIYAEFGSKEGLFTALVTQSAEIALAALDDNEEGPERTIDEILRAFGSRLMTVYFSPALLGVFRAIMTEALRFPELAQSFFDKGPGQAQAKLSAVLRKARQRGEIHVDDPDAAASHFLGMLRDNLHLEVVLGLRSAPSEAEIEKHVVSAVEVFTQGVGSVPRQNTARKAVRRTAR